MQSKGFSFGAFDGSAGVAHAQVLRQSGRMGGQIFLLVIGVSLIFWPRLFTAMGPKAHGRRLSLLQAGEPEAFFEERRALETWPPPKDSPVWRRILGVLMILTAAGLFFLDYTSRREAEVEHAAMIEARDAADKHVGNE